jgi:hypothetical protein
VDDHFGPLQLDLMSSEHLTHFAAGGSRLPYISRFVTPGAAGADVFRQHLRGGGICCYAHPPVPLVAALLAFLREEEALCTMVVPAEPAQDWWRELLPFESLLLARRGDAGATVILSGAAAGGFVEGPPLAADLVAFRVNFTRA